MRSHPVLLSLFALVAPVALPFALRAQDAPRSFRLSPREREVLACLVRRDTAREIADRFGVSERTVEHQVASIYNKLGVNSRREATALALRCGLA